MLPTENSFSSNPEVTAAARINNVGLDEESGSSAGQAFFEEEWLITIDLGKCLHCLLQNPTLKLVVISSSSFSSQIIGSTSRLSLVFVSSLEEKKDEEEEECDEDAKTGGGVLAF